MWPPAHHLSIRASGADALFVSALQRSDNPSASQIRQAIAAAIGASGYSGCAGRVAQEFGVLDGQVAGVLHLPLRPGSG